jgi:two-component system, response regulator PdtaR
MDVAAVLPRARRRRPPITSPEQRRLDEASEQPPRILIVEDEYLVATEIEAGLSENGFGVVGLASTAAEAIRMAVAERPTLIVMDIRLAGDGDGIEAAAEIYKTTGIRCIFATAYAASQLEDRARQAAPLGWLAKPYEVDRLIDIIRGAIDRLKQ